MKKQIKVYLQYPWKFPDSPYYKYLIDNPPKGIEYLNTKKQKGVITNRNKFLFSNKIKKIIRGAFKILHLSISNAHISPEGDYDLIHCAHCLSKNKDKPWVADIEALWQFYVGNKNRFTKNKIRKILMRSNCKKILPWTEKTKKEIIEEFPEIKNKVEVVYPAIQEKKFKKIETKRIHIIFSGRYFYWKGGFHALDAIDKLTKKYKNVYGIFNSDVPKEIKERYQKNSKISFHGLISQEKLFELYQESDIMIYPGYSDTFGFAFLEAMSFGIPVITVEGFARKELIEDKKTGLVIEKRLQINQKEIRKINEELISKIEKETSKMIENKKSREEMSQNCLRAITHGKFSIKERNKRIWKIYEEAIK